MKSYLHMSVPERAPTSGEHGCADGGSWLLIIDDDRMTGRALSRWVSHVTGYQVRVARTIHQAECWLRVMELPVAVITDFELAGESGLEGLKHFRELGFRCPVAIITGAPALALAALEAESLTETIPVFSKSEAHESLSDWLDRLRFSWAASA
jgi:DNA-binding NtrC family response regulator